MEITARKGLESLIPKLETMVADILQERRDLDLVVPSDFSTIIEYNTGEGSAAEAMSSPQGSSIHINTVPLVMPKLNKKELKIAQGIMYYITTCQDLMGGSREEAVMGFIENPKGMFERYESAFEEAKKENRGPGLEGVKEFLAQRGRTYDDYKSFIIKKAPKARRYLKRMASIIGEKIDNAGLDELRHEMDHVAIFESPMFGQLYRKNREVNNLLNNFMSNRSKENSQKLGRAKMQELKLIAGENPISEIKAFFFNYIPMGKWKEADFDKVRAMVLERYLRSYVVGNQVESIVESLVARKWAQGQMDRQTSNYIFRAATERIGSVAAERYVVELKDVDYKIAAQVLYKELPEWQARFARNAQRAVEVIGNAYKEDPSRLKRANQARTAEEFLELAAA